MSTEFDCRLLLGRAYREAVRDLEAVARGDDAALGSIRERCLVSLEQGTFRQWHSALDGYLLRDWLNAVNTWPARASVEVARQVAEVFIALVAMPDFQLAYRYGTEKSPNLVVLAEDDGGLYGALCDADAWFDGLFLERFPRSSVEYRVGRAMIILDRADLERLAKGIEKLTDDRCELAPFPEVCRTARARLASLVRRCLAIDDGMLAVSESG